MCSAKNSPKRSKSWVATSSPPSASALRFCSFDMTFLRERVLGWVAAALPPPHLVSPHMRLSLLPEEREQRGVDFVGVSPADVVRTALDRDESAIGNQRREPRGGRVERKDAVLGAVHNEYRDVDLRQVRPEVGQPGIDACVGREWRGAGRDVEAGLPCAVADSDAAEDVDVVEVVEEVLEVRVAIVDDSRLDIGEDLAVDALGVIVGLEQERRDGTEQCCFAYPLRPVGGEVARDLAGAHRETDENHIAEVEVLNQRVQICSEGVVVVADGRLTRAAEAAAVITDHSIAVCEQIALLAFPRVAIQRVTVDQHDRLSGAVVLV